MYLGYALSKCLFHGSALELTILLPILEIGVVLRVSTRGD
jgi:hypothetical protein